MVGVREFRVFALAQDRASRRHGVFRTRKIQLLLPVGGERGWVGTGRGCVRWNGTPIRRVALPLRVVVGKSRS